MRKFSKDDIDNLLRLTGAFHIVQNGDKAEAERATDRVVDYVRRLAASFGTEGGG